MTLIPWPSDIFPSEIEWRQPPVRTWQQSMITGRTRVAVLGFAARWYAAVTMPPMPDDKAVTFRAFLARLLNPINWTELAATPFEQASSNFSATVHATIPAGAVTGQVATSAPASTLLLRAGQFLSIGPDTTRQLVILTQDLVAGAGGVATATFAQPLRVATAAGTPVLIRFPTARMTIRDPLAWRHSVGDIYDVALEMEEAF